MVDKFKCAACNKTHTSFDRAAQCCLTLVNYGKPAKQAGKPGGYVGRRPNNHVRFNEHQMNKQSGRCANPFCRRLFPNGWLTVVSGPDSFCVGCGNRKFAATLDSVHILIRGLDGIDARVAEMLGDRADPETALALNAALSHPRVAVALEAMEAVNKNGK